jgi:hypothetical protein
MFLRWFLSFLLLVSTLVFLPSCGLLVRETEKGITKVANSELFWQGRHGTLSEQEMEWAKIAWKYFINNYNEDTGLVNGVDGFHVASIWNVADTIAATVTAHRLELIDNYEFDHRITPLLEFLNSMPLSYGQLPNAFYDTEGGEMTDGAGGEYESSGSGKDTDSSKNAKESAVGWSAVDIGRLLVWLQVLSDYAPQYTEYIDKAILRWNFCKVINECGELSGVNPNSSKEPLSRFPKEPLGYYEYALMGYATWGFPRPPAKKKDAPTVEIYGIKLPNSREDSRKTGISDPLVSLPYLLLGLEFNWDRFDDSFSADAYSSNTALADLAQRIYKVQEKRYQHEGIFTAKTNYRRSKPPYLLYDTIFADGYAWNTLTPEGEQHPDLALVANSAAFGMWALWKTSYTDGLMQLIRTLHDPEQGWFEGRKEKDGGYERTLSCTTNAVVLEALYYKMYGKIYTRKRSKSYADLLMENEFRRPSCSPLDLKECPFK